MLKAAQIATTTGISPYTMIIFPCSLREVDADVEVITYDHIRPMLLRKYDPSRLDAPEVKVKKEHMLIYRKKELQYWKVR